MAVNPIQLQKFLGGVDYPAQKDDLVRHAERHGVDKEALDTLRRIPDRQYDGPNAVSAAVGAEA
ncbi:MAG: hypothetical protein QOG57_5115 [Pseudonocardiales bacterium]|nr:hypothetical protein [Pseudonocardiales bacterium]